MSDRGELVWRKSSRSGGADCVEISDDGPVVHMRDSKHPDGPTLTFDRAVFRDFIQFVKENQDTWS